MQVLQNNISEFNNKKSQPYFRNRRFLMGIYKYMTLLGNALHIFNE